MRQEAVVGRLWQRREEACKKFAVKNVENIRCRDWFVRRENSIYTRRTGTAYKTFKEPNSRTDRHWNSLVNYARRILNNIS